MVGLVLRDSRSILGSWHNHIVYCRRSRLRGAVLCCAVGVVDDGQPERRQRSAQGTLARTLRVVGGLPPSPIRHPAQSWRSTTDVLCAGTVP